MFAGMDEEIELGIVQSIGLRSAGQDEDIRGYVSSCCMHHHALRMFHLGDVSIYNNNQQFTNLN